MNFMNFQFIVHFLSIEISEISELCSVQVHKIEVNFMNLVHWTKFMHNSVRYFAQARYVTGTGLGA